MMTLKQMLDSQRQTRDTFFGREIKEDDYEIIERLIAENSERKAEIATLKQYIESSNVKRRFLINYHQWVIQRESLFTALCYKQNLVFTDRISFSFSVRGDEVHFTVYHLAEDSNQVTRVTEYTDSLEKLISVSTLAL